MGAAYSRFKVLKELQDSNTIIVLVDLDDALQNSALKIVADTYRANENVKLTIGEFKSMNGSKYINGYYNEETVNNQTYHKVKNFKCPALRTFKSEMIKALDKKLFHDHKGKWLMGCTDVALMISLMKQLTYDEISYIRKPIYFYRKTRRNNTIGRFSAKEKKKLFRQITQRLGQTKFENGQYTIANYSSLKNIKGTKNTRIPSVTKIYRRN